MANFSFCLVKLSVCRQAILFLSNRNGMNIARCGYFLNAAACLMLSRTIKTSDDFYFNKKELKVINIQHSLNSDWPDSATSLLLHPKENFRMKMEISFSYSLPMNTSIIIIASLYSQPNYWKTESRSWAFSWDPTSVATVLVHHR